MSEAEAKNVRGSPAGITTMSQPVRAFSSPSSLGRYPHVIYGDNIQCKFFPEPRRELTAGEAMWERSAATPGVFTTS